MHEDIVNHHESNSENSQRIANGFNVTKCFHRFMAMEKVLCLSISIQMIMAVFYYETSFLSHNHDDTTVLILAGNLTAVFSSICFVLSRRVFNDLKRAEKNENETVGMIEMIFGILVLLVQPVIFFEGISARNWNYVREVYQHIQVNHLLVLAELLKLWILVPAIMNMLKYKNPRGTRVCQIYNCRNSILYQFKCYFKDHPIKQISILFLCSITIFTFCFRVCERDPSTSRIFNSIQNCIWLVVVTMTSVGFGDYYPETLFGRIIGVLCVFCGVLTVSIMVLVVVNTFQLDQRENKSLKILKKLMQKEELKKTAGLYISHTLSRLWKNRKYKTNILQNLQQKNLKRLLRRAMNQAKFNSSSEIDLAEEMSIQFERAGYWIENLNTNCDSFIDFLSKQLLVDTQNLKKKEQQ